MTQIRQPDPLELFEIQNVFVRPALQACRWFNTTFDYLFYDIPSLARDLRSRGDEVSTTPEGRNSPTLVNDIDLSAITDPEGALLVIDPTSAPYIQAYRDVAAFIESQKIADRPIKVITITGVGSSALGSAAFAWNVALGLKQPVLAIVPGYGVADAALQGLGGWYGFGLFNALQTKAQLQNILAVTAPKVAELGRNLSASSPNAATLNNAPVFRTGCGSSDVLHDLMENLKIDWVVGHSKGALSIYNALHSLPYERTQDLNVVTLGCPISEDQPATYHQFLGVFDALGALNAWGNRPNTWVPTQHSTNTNLSFSMHVEAIAAACKSDVR